MPAALRVVVAAVLVAGASAAAANDPDPGGGPCHVYWKPSTFDPGIPGVTNPGTPYVICGAA